MTGPVVPPAQIPVERGDYAKVHWNYVRVSNIQYRDVSTTLISHETRMNNEHRIIAFDWPLTATNPKFAI